MRRTVLLTAGATLLLAAAGCGSDSGGSSGSGETLHISETEYKLDPSSVSVDKAGSVTLHVVDDGSENHALEIEGNGVEEETETLSPGDSADLTVDLKPGTYEVYCPIDGHRKEGMEGELVVAGGSSGSGSTTEDDDSGGVGY
jgi:plastocyanin